MADLDAVLLRTSFRRPARLHWLAITAAEVYERDGDPDDR